MIKIRKKQYAVEPAFARKLWAWVGKCNSGLNNVMSADYLGERRINNMVTML